MAPVQIAGARASHAVLPAVPPPAGAYASCCSTRGLAAWRMCSARPSPWRCPALGTRGLFRCARAALTSPSQARAGPGREGQASPAWQSRYQSHRWAHSPIFMPAPLTHPLLPLRACRGEPARVCGAVRRLLAQPLHPLPVRGLCQGLPDAVRRAGAAGGWHPARLPLGMGSP